MSPATDDDPSSSKPPPLTASYLTLAGARFREPTIHNIFERATAAQAAGYAGIGATLAELALITEASFGRSPWQAIREELPVPIRELEWLELSGPDFRRRAREAALIASALHVTTLNVGVARAGEVDDFHIEKRLEHIAGLVRPQGITVAFEPCRFGAIWNPWRVLKITQMVNQANAGLLYDTWQQDAAAHGHPGWTFTMNPFTTNLASIQLSGTPDFSSEDMFTCAQDLRTVPDESTTEHLVALLARAHGPWPPMSVECASQELRKMGCKDAALATFEAASAVLEDVQARLHPALAHAGRG